MIKINSQNGLIKDLVAGIIHRKRTFSGYSEFSAGFIPMIIMLLLFVAEWFGLFMKGWLARTSNCDSKTKNENTSHQ
jgi:hypothetical protein